MQPTSRTSSDSGTSGLARGAGLPAGTRVARRTALRGGVGAVLLVPGSALLAACAASGPSRSAAPGRTKAKTVITMNGIFGTGQQRLQTMISLYQEAFAPFLQKNPDIEVRITPKGNTVAALVAGAGDDIIWDWVFYPYWQGNLLLRLDPYLKRDEVNTSLWVQGQMDLFQRPFGTYMLGAYFSPFVLAARLDYFNALGLPAPDPNWTHVDFARTCRALTKTGPGGQKRYGGAIEWFSNGIMGATYILTAFGGGLTDAAGTASWLGRPGSIAAGNWLYQDLFWPGIAAPHNVSKGHQWLSTGRIAMNIEWGTAPFTLARQLGQTMPWTFLPFPVFPKGRFTAGTNDFYGINAQTKHPEEAWRVLNWATSQPEFQIAKMRIAGLQPTLKSLWPQWQQQVEAVAPLLKGKGLRWFVDAATKGYALSQQPYRYSGVTVENAVDQEIAKLWQRGSTVDLAFTQAAKQADTLLTEAAASGGTVVVLHGSGTAALAKQAPPLKGPLSAWQTTPVIAASAKDIERGPAGKWSPAVASLAVAALWDTKALHLGIEVTQGHPYTQTSSGANMWKGDMVWLFFDTRPAMAIGNTGKLGLSKTPAGLQAWNAVTNQLATIPMQFAQGPHGWWIAATIPWSLVGPLQPKSGTVIGFNAGIGWAPMGSTTIVGFFDLNGQNPDTAGSGIALKLA